MFEDGLQRIAGQFTRREPRLAARAFVAGLLSQAERKTCWQLAEQAGYRQPAPLQRLLRTAAWDAEQVLADVQTLLVERLGDPHGVLIPDETGFVKQGAASVGVQRQYTGTVGRIENSQVAVFLAYAGAGGRALLDRRLYLPEHTWCADTSRRTAAGVPDDIGFATKPRLALDMIDAAVRAGIPAGWVTGDEVYGADPDLRAGVRAHGLGHVLAIGCNRRVAVNDGRTRLRADEVAARLTGGCWQRMSAGVGAKGPRDYDWAQVVIGTGGKEYLLVRRHPHTGELAFYLCWSPRRVPLATLIRVAGSRWAVEECFQSAKNETGLDHYQVRGWTGWHRFTALAMLALAILAICAGTQPAEPADPTRSARSGTPIRLTLPEIRRLLNTLMFTPAPDIEHALHWSAWRRIHQAVARQAHYQRRLSLSAT
ncbi:IS701 family transposase [Micromonospora acroterricola]|uniref:IS701 family transposase n=1 Tax=Micromonospora acroterricola TaxID=2202421 RepID=A0A317D3A5_9ACTN|nr:IS701 family transposase [Micromonospora acroterricola]